MSSNPMLAYMMAVNAGLKQAPAQRQMQAGAPLPGAMPQTSFPQPLNYDATRPANYDATRPANYDATRPANYDATRPPNYDAIGAAPALKRADGSSLPPWDPSGAQTMPDGSTRPPWQNPAAKADTAEGSRALQEMLRSMQAGKAYLDKATAQPAMGAPANPQGQQLDVKLKGAKGAIEPLMQSLPELVQLMQAISQNQGGQ